MKISELLIESNVYDFKTKKSVSPVSMSMLQAFGSDQLNILHNAGIKLIEKPDYWEDLDRKSVDPFTFARVQKVLNASGYPLINYDANKIYGASHRPRSPVARVLHMPEEKMFTITFSDGSKYIVDSTGASSYIRFWVKVS